MDGRQIEIVRDQDPYTRVLRSLILDSSLRLQTRMVLIMMLSVPADWDFSIRGMAKIANVTKDTMAKMLTELEDAGYVQRKTQGRGEAGQFAKAGYLVSGKPIFREGAGTGHKNYDTVEPCPDSSYTKEPYTKNSPQLNNKQLTTKQSSSPCSPPEGDAPAEEPEGVDNPKPPDKPDPRRTRREKSAPAHDPEAFEIFWAEYPRKDDRKAAIRAWDKLKPDRKLCRVMYAALMQQRGSRQWAEEKGRYIPLFSTWLNGRKWENQGVDLSLLPQPRDTGGWADDPEVAS